jgi:hypothetical protein
MVTVISMEQKPRDFCPKYVQEYPLCTAAAGFLKLPVAILAFQSNKTTWNLIIKYVKVCTKNLH